MPLKNERENISEESIFKSCCSTRMIANHFKKTYQNAQNIILKEIILGI